MPHSFYSNFETALSKLNQFLHQGIQDDLDRAGLIQGFEFTFEQCWKAIQKQAKHEGLTAASPRQAFKTALSWGWIKEEDEANWLEMTKDRNATTHVYRDEVAHSLTDKIVKVYAPALNQILKK